MLLKCENPWGKTKQALDAYSLSLTAFRLVPYPLEKGHLFHPYPACTENADRELLPGKNNRSYSCSRYWTGTGLQWRLVREIIISLVLHVSLGCKLFPAQYRECGNGPSPCLACGSLGWPLYHRSESLLPLQGLSYKVKKGNQVFCAAKWRNNVHIFLLLWNNFDKRVMQKRGLVTGLLSHPQCKDLPWRAMVK